MAKGMLYGVSTGPGDPELMTLKAIKVIEACPIIAAPRTKGENCMALDIVKGAMDVSGKEIIYIESKMSRDKDILASTHKEQAEKIIACLAEGKDVAMLNIGDASVYGTFTPIRDLVRDAGYETSTVPGVTSFSAVAAALDESLTSTNEPLMIVPGSYKDMDKVLDFPGSKVLMKSGSQLPGVKAYLRKYGLEDRSSLVANCGLENERIYKDIRESSDDEGYFSTIIVAPEEKNV
ncbi:MAG: precorrin-2 C(20)-methyltransferase [Eubacteriaceae bacterium]|nr:precorrin-2 C(20)-methyltransferase [Eubacteriaceae bacterium]